MDFVTNLIKNAGVAAVPGRGFFHSSTDDPSYHHRYVRFAFCKSNDTLNAAAEKMRKLAVSHDARLLRPTDDGEAGQTASATSPWSQPSYLRSKCYFALIFGEPSSIQVAG